MGRVRKGEELGNLRSAKKREDAMWELVIAYLSCCRVVSVQSKMGEVV